MYRGLVYNSIYNDCAGPLSGYETQHDPLKNGLKFMAPGDFLGKRGRQGGVALREFPMRLLKIETVFFMKTRVEHLFLKHHFFLGDILV